MTAKMVAILGIGLVVLIAVAANWAIRDQAQLPMQWGLAGQVNWSAPRWVALGLMPVVALLVLGASAAAGARSVPVMLLEASVMVVVECLYVGLLAGTVGMAA